MMLLWCYDADNNDAINDDDDNNDNNYNYDNNNLNSDDGKTWYLFFMETEKPSTFSLIENVLF